ncbi:MAG: DNA mismatch repair protein MutS [Myxococcales bacterium]|nr:DNA mismatch repair protein MutS [Myxococcales bacterium]|tara:strand:- start:930 stop:1679 length:750 start_codon:yes stop_codon:yes gene_type:complete
MGRKKKKKKGGTTSPKEKTSNHSPFAELSHLKKELRKGNKTTSPSTKTPDKIAPKTSSDEGLFEQAMAGVQPVSSDRVDPIAYQLEKTASVTPNNEEEQVFAELQMLVRGETRFEFRDSTEIIEGKCLGIDPQLVRRLRKGRYSVQAHLDLHGMDAQSAKEATRAFIIQSVKNGHRCVLIIHGKGLHSKSEEPVLKHGLKIWLSKGTVGRCILAFTSALPHDGGTGAIYVLLRKSAASGSKKKPILTIE